MHDFHEADKILKLILESAAANKLIKVNKAVIELGRIIEHGDQITPENLKFNILLLSKNTVAEGLQLEIISIDGAHWVLKEIEGE